MVPQLTFWVQNKLKNSYLAKNRDSLRFDDFSIISSNCLGGIIYKDLGLPYKTPLVNMFMYCDCFVKMMADFKSYMEADLTFANQSKYVSPDQITYPLGILKDIEIHFVHVKNTSDAMSSWNRRKTRINYDKMIVMMCERDGCSEDAIRKFDQLPFEHKICFTVREYPFARSAVKIPGSILFKEIPPADQLAGIAYSTTDIIGYINRACE
jgi:uncharacterized protein (DUF1919 family)